MSDPSTSDLEAPVDRPETPGVDATESADAAAGEGAFAGSPEFIPDDSTEAGPSAEELPGPTITDAAKLIRLGTMTQSLMNEARQAPLDDRGRALLARIHSETMAALADTISGDLLEELEEFQICMDCDDEPPTESELRIAQAQLVGWLQGLHQGFQAMAMAQQAAAMQQLQQLQAGRGPGANHPDSIDAASRPGTYL